MAKIIIEGKHSNFNFSYPTDDNPFLKGKKKYQARIHIDIKSEICCTQVQFVSDETKPDYWTKEELLFAFNEAYLHIMSYINCDNQIDIFGENIFYPKTENTQISELLEHFEIEIPENSKNIDRMINDLLCIKEAQENFKICKDKLFEVISWSPSQINNSYYGITNLIYFISNINQAGVAMANNNEGISLIRMAFEDLRKRKDMNNSTYKTHHVMAQQKIYCLQFPNYFKTKLPKINIQKALDEVR